MDKHKQVETPAGLALLERLRTICTQFPEVQERVDSFGHTTFRVGDKPFVMIGERGLEASFSLKTTPHTQELLLHKGGYTKTPYIGQHGWVSVSGFTTPDWEEIEGLIQEGYLRTAPKRLANLYREQQGQRR
ncbi:MmcQ/YjbR family DNA-binding protein [Brevibacillus borstelensis]|uniref:MmcQ/YjbR family DNA-binding protein n=1 Tax=Brevibacillus borstelensis TaxID=45462 RepID=UPI00287FABE8|nr:MmcQ/YjbR family DNA-binding protein [Brevibacillus borstelensis]WNF08161.1 MmcQ/YjbR family DNA-binding protein [Brevibacillus borstelensis]